jgi:hypothetical protein
MKASLVLLFAISTLGAFAQSSNVKSDTARVPGNENTRRTGLLQIKDYFGKPLVAGFHYDYAASLTNKTVSSTLTVDYGDKIPKEGATIVIYDTTGRLLQSSSYKESGRKETVELSSSIKPHCGLPRGRSRSAKG